MNVHYVFFFFYEILLELEWKHEDTQTKKRVNSYSFAHCVC